MQLPTLSLMLLLASVALSATTAAVTDTAYSVFSVQQSQLNSVANQAYNSLESKARSELGVTTAINLFWGDYLASQLGIVSFAEDPSIIIDAPPPTYISDLPADIRTVAEKLFTSYWEADATIVQEYVSAELAALTASPGVISTNPSLSATSTVASPSISNSPLPGLSTSPTSSTRSTVPKIPVVTVRVTETPSGEVTADGIATTTTASPSSSTAAAATKSLPLQLGVLAAGAVGAAAVLL